MSMIDTILHLTRDFIAIPSTADNPEAKRAVIERAKQELTGFTIEDFKQNDSPSILVYAAPKRPEKFSIILNAHLDVVPAHAHQFTMEQKEGRIYGRGTSDMKAAAAVELLVFKKLAASLPYPIALQLVTDEEVGGFDGTKHQVDHGVRADFIIAGEPTDMRIGTMAKGILWAVITTHGESAHGAYPWNGQNAIMRMMPVLDALRTRYPVPEKESWKTTVNIAKIGTSNTSFNKVPADCQVSIDMRFIPEDAAHVEQDLRALLPAGVDIHITENEPSQFTSPDNPYLLRLQNVIKQHTSYTGETMRRHGGSDLRFYDPVGGQGIEFGPVGAGLHTDTEYSDIRCLEDYYQVLSTFVANPEGNNSH